MVMSVSPTTARYTNSYYYHLNKMYIGFIMYVTLAKKNTNITVLSTDSSSH